MEDGNSDLDIFLTPDTYFGSRFTVAGDYATELFPTRARTLTRTPESLRFSPLVPYVSYVPYVPNNPNDPIDPNDTNDTNDLSWHLAPLFLEQKIRFSFREYHGEAEGSCDDICRCDEHQADGRPGLAVLLGFLRKGHQKLGLQGELDVYRDVKCQCDGAGSRVEFIPQAFDEICRDEHDNERCGGQLEEQKGQPGLLADHKSQAHEREHEVYQQIC